MMAETPGRASAATPATSSKPSAGQMLAAGVTVGQTSAARCKATPGQLTCKLEQSSSTPLVEVVAGEGLSWLQLSRSVCNAW